jgi:thioredoxin
MIHVSTSKMEHITLMNFEEKVVNSKLPVVLDFYADWCGPCKMLGPIFEEVSKEFEGKVNFFKVDTTTEQGLAAKFGVQGIPLLIFLRDGEEIGRNIGVIQKDALIDKVKKIFDL